MWFWEWQMNHRLNEHCQFDEYPEVGMVGLLEARQQSKGIDEGACEVQKQGVCVDLELGESLLETAVCDIIRDIESLLS